MFSFLFSLFVLISSAPYSSLDNSRIFWKFCVCVIFVGHGIVSFCFKEKSQLDEAGLGVLLFPLKSSFPKSQWQV